MYKTYINLFYCTCMSLARHTMCALLVIIGDNMIVYSRSPDLKYTKKSLRTVREKKGWKTTDFCSVLLSRRKPTSNTFGEKTVRD